MGSSRVINTMYVHAYLLVVLIMHVYGVTAAREQERPGHRQQQHINAGFNYKNPPNLLRADRWWLDQSPVDWSVQCHYPAAPQVESSAAFCARTLQINCRPSSVRAVYQNVVFETPADQISLSVRSSGEQLEPAATASFMGVY